MRVSLEVNEEMVREEAQRVLRRELRKSERKELIEFVRDEFNWMSDGLVIGWVEEKKEEEELKK